MFDKQFEKELDLVSLALESEEGEKKIIKYLNPLVISVANDFIEEYESKKGLRLDKNKKIMFPKLVGLIYILH